MQENDPPGPEVAPESSTEQAKSTTYAAQLQFDRPPRSIYHFREQYLGGAATICPNTNFLKGVKWSPDGACFLTASDDNCLRIFDLPAEAYSGELKSQSATELHDETATDSFAAALQVQEGELVYDYAWYSRMHTSDPVSCCFATTSRAHPIHLWDACSGSLRCVYRAYDAADEITAAYSLAFHGQGSRIWAGYNKAIRVFDLSRPGRDCQTITTFQKGQDGQPGIISCLDFSPDDPNLMAAGSYSSVAAVYDATSGSAAFILSGHKGGLTQVKFSADGNFLYTGARKDTDILCWDIRYTSDVVYRLQRDTGDTNQRIQFDIEPMGRHLATGGSDGKVVSFDLTTGEPVSTFLAATDTLNGFQFHPYLPLAATASGRSSSTGTPSPVLSSQDV
ncbi:TPA: hypothetical protein ACH3X3_000587 [Trebouxia sp. C0006]